jgi:hypothetical protein
MLHRNYLGVPDPTHREDLLTTNIRQADLIESDVAVLQYVGYYYLVG